MVLRALDAFETSDAQLTTVVRSLCYTSCHPSPPLAYSCFFLFLFPMLVVAPSTGISVVLSLFSPLPLTSISARTHWRTHTHQQMTASVANWFPAGGWPRYQQRLATSIEKVRRLLRIIIFVLVLFVSGYTHGNILLPQRFRWALATYIA